MFAAISNSEQLSVCIRYVRGAKVVERFIGFLHSKDCKAITISEGIQKLLQRAGLLMEKCIAQLYDGASLMSGDQGGVQTLIENLVGGDCPYVHCHSHRLNLVLVDCSSEISEIHELLGLLQSKHTFQSYSPRRAQFLESAREELNQMVLKMPSTCDTRWFSKRKGVYFFKNQLQAFYVLCKNSLQTENPTRQCYARVS